MRKGDIISANIFASADDGRGLARTDDGFVIFINEALPGETVTAKIYSKKNKYAEAELISVEEKSSSRTDATCKYFGLCGGCSWQHIDYSCQLQLKQSRVEDLFKRSGLQFEKINKIIPSPAPFYYRNRLEYFFSDREWLKNNDGDVIRKPALGFHPANVSTHVLNVDECFLQNDLSNKIRNAVYNFCIDNEITFYNRKTKEGLLRSIVIRTTLTGETMLVLTASEENTQLYFLLNYIKRSFLQVTSLLFGVSSDFYSDRYKIKYKVFSGHEFITEKLNNLYFKLGAVSFFQPNPAQAENLFATAIALAELNKNDVVYDIYCGTGTLSCFAAEKAGKVIGVEYSPEAISMARENALLNSLNNIDFFEGDARNVLTPAFIYNNGLADVVVTDPPRAGMSPFVIHRILRMEPRKIAYISCNPTAQIKDLKLLAKKYKITHLQPFDMFPQTAHIENIAVLERG